MCEAVPLFSKKFLIMFLFLQQIQQKVKNTDDYYCLKCAGFRNERDMAVLELKHLKEKYDSKVAELAALRAEHKEQRNKEHVLLKEIKEGFEKLPGRVL